MSWSSWNGAHFLATLAAMGDIQHQGLTYFTELPGEELLGLLSRPGVARLLRQSSAAVSMAMLDLGEARRRAVSLLNDNAVPVTAWLVLDREDGYWLTADNPALARRQYRRVRGWAWRHDLALEAVGLDIEIPLDDSVALMEQGSRALWRLVRRRRSVEKVKGAARQYAGLVEEIRGDGLRTETYQYFMILDDRLARSTLLQRVLGIVDLSADREVLMLYRSTLPGLLGELLVDAFGPEAGGIGVGITGGGVEALQGFFQRRELDLPGLLVELRRARRHTRHVYVFSLEGCVDGGYLEELCRADLRRAAPGAHLARLASPARAVLRTMLRVERLWDRFHKS